MNRDGKKKNSKDAGFHDSFQGMKGISSPWRGIDGVMMD
jgi:hypothetical protein